MTAKEILDQLTNDEITPDEALAELEGLGWGDAIFYWGFVDDEGIESRIVELTYDYKRLKNFLEDLGPEQEWHYVDGNGWCNDTDFKDTVIDFINDHMEED